MMDLNAAVRATREHRTANVQHRVHQTENRRNEVLAHNRMRAGLVRRYDERHRGAQQQQRGHRMVDQLVDGLRDDAAGAQREQARDEQTEGADHEAGAHQQEEEQLMVRIRIVGVVPGHDAHANGADDLEILRAELLVIVCLKYTTIMGRIC